MYSFTSQLFINTSNRLQQYYFVWLCSASFLVTVLALDLVRITKTLRTVIHAPVWRNFLEVGLAEAVHRVVINVCPSLTALQFIGSHQASHTLDQTPEGFKKAAFSGGRHTQLVHVVFKSCVALGSTPPVLLTL